MSSDEIFLHKLGQGLQDPLIRAEMIQSMPLAGAPEHAPAGLPEGSVVLPTLRLGKILEANIHGASYPPTPQETRRIGTLLVAATLLESELSYFNGPEAVHIQAAGVAEVFSSRINMWQHVGSEATLSVDPHDRTFVLSAGFVINAATQLQNILQS